MFISKQYSIKRICS